MKNNDTQRAIRSSVPEHGSLCGCSKLTWPNSNRPSRLTVTAIAFVLAAIMFPAAANDSRLGAIRNAKNPVLWVCECSPDPMGDWFVTCRDLEAVLADDPVLGSRGAPSAVRLPLYGPPFSDSPLAYLASSVLCGANENCDVQLARF